MATRLRAFLDKANDPDLNEKFNSAIAGISVVALLAWAGYAFIYAPSQSATPPVDAAELRSQTIRELTIWRDVAQTFSVESPRVQVLKANNVDVYMSEAEFEHVPFPDRAGAVEKIGGVWCDNADWTFAPSVRIRDSRSGRVFDRYNCLIHELRKRWRAR